MTTVEEFLTGRPNRQTEAAFIALCASWHRGGRMVPDQLTLNTLVHLRDEIIGFGRTPPKVPTDLSMPQLHEWASKEMANLPCRVCGGGTVLRESVYGVTPIAVRCVCEEET